MGEILITSTILIAALLLLRKFSWGKISRRLQYGLWLLAAVRLLAPAQLLTSPLSVMQLVETAGEAVYAQIARQEERQEEQRAVQQSNRPEQSWTDAQNGQSVKDTQQYNENKVQPGTQVQAGMHADGSGTQSDAAGLSQGVNGQTMQNSTAQNSTLQDSITQAIGNLAGAIYIVGVFIVAGVLFACNLRFRRQLRAKRQLIGQEGRLKVYLAEGLDSPCLCGVFAPAIYLNEAGLATEERRHHILLHELTHYRHGDHIWTLVRSLCLVLYWFHPLVWAAAAISARDSELACDEGTLARLGEDSRQAYGRTLIEMTTGENRGSGLLYCATGMINRKKEIKERITAIAAGRKQMLGAAAGVIVLAVLLAACTAGEAPQEAEKNLSTGQDASRRQDMTESQNAESESQQAETEGQQAEAEETAEAFPPNEDGSYRLSEYKADLTGEKKAERIVFDVFYWADLTAKADVITEELLWEELWNGCEVIAKVLTGEGAEEKVLWEQSYSEAHAGNGNLAVVSEDGQKYLLQYANLMYQGFGGFEYQLLQFTAESDTPVRVKENSASYEGNYGTYTEDEIVKVLEVEAELEEYLSAYDTDILLNASVSGRESCYLYGSKEGLLNGVRRQTAFEVFMTEVGGNGWELSLKDFFYPEGTESLTAIPEDAEARIRAGEILCMEVSPENATAGRLDLDGDGIREVLYLYAVSDWYRDDGWRDGIIDENYRIRVNDRYYEAYCDIMDPVLMAFSPDGEQILLAVYDDGPSGDPLTSFFRYDASGVYPAGSITDDLREVTIDENGVIQGRFRADMIQTEWAYGYYYWNGSEIVMREDEVYYLLDDSGWREAYDTPLMLLTELTVYEERSEESRALVMKPQKVSNVATDRKEWILLEAEDGTRGWLKLDGWEIPSLDGLKTYEVFEGLNMAD